MIIRYLTQSSLHRKAQPGLPKSPTYPAYASEAPKLAATLNLQQEHQVLSPQPLHPGARKISIGLGGCDSGFYKYHVRSRYSPRLQSIKPENLQSSICTSVNQHFYSFGSSFSDSIS